VIRILLCRCNQANRLSGEMINAAIELSKNSAVSLTQVDDLCGLAARNPEWLQRFTEFHNVHVAACHPRTVQAILESVQAKATAAQTFDLTNLDQEILNELAGVVNNSSAGVSENAQDVLPILPESSTRTGIPEDWKPWYPLIDHTRCTNCGQCASFCLFNVYSREEDGTIHVENPQGCKINCPACARICPQAAIIFPKYSGGGAIAGEPVHDETVESDRIRVDMKKILGNNPYEALKLRQKRQQLLKKETSFDQETAEAERNRCAGDNNRRFSQTRDTNSPFSSDSSDRAGNT